jgi:glycogen debranching enzyme
MTQLQLRSDSRGQSTINRPDSQPESTSAQPRQAQDDGYALTEELRSLLLRNVREGYSNLLGQHYCYIAPSPKTYPFQWFWDTCFHVVILTRLGEYERAKRNLRSLFAMQEPDGFVGHMIFWHQMLPKRHTDVLQARPTWESLRPHMSGLIQPTFAAYALLRLFEACDDRVYLGEMYARVKRYHDWLAQNRDFDGDGLLTIISPFESGMDWKPSYDLVLGYAERTTPDKLYWNKLFWKGVDVDLCNFLSGYDLKKIRQRGRFLVKDVAFNVIYAQDLAAMQTLAQTVGDGDASAYKRRRQQVEQSIMHMMYDEADAAFYDLHEPGSRRLRTRTPTIFFPLALESVSDDRANAVLERHFSGCA